jgi:hypothetical protein
MIHGVDMMSKRAKLLWSVIALVLCLTGITWGQETTGSIEVTVSDTQGARVPNVAVTVTGVDRGFNQTVNTDESGFARVLQVPSGLYKVSIAASGGFGAALQDNVRVVLGNATPVNITLQAAGVGASVNVAASDVSAIDPTASRIQTNITDRQIELLPKGTNFTSALKAAAPVRQEPAAAGFQIDGASGSENTFILDGQEVTNFRTGTLNVNNNVPFQFVQEIQVKTNGFEAEYGGATGGVINVVTKSGGNSFHGEFGIQFEPSKLFARPRDILNSDPNTLSYLQVRRDSFTNTFPTATLSGPIIKDRLWFLVSASPQFFDTRRTFTFADGTTQTYIENDRADYEFARLDAAITSKLRVNGSYTYNPYRQHGAIPGFVTLSSAGTVSNAPSPAGQSILGGRQPASNVALNADYIATPKLVLNFRYGRSYLNEKISSYGIPNAVRYVCATAGPQCAAGYNNITNNFFTDRDISIRNIYEANASLQVDNFLGRHQFKFGYQRNHIKNDVSEGYLSTGVLVLRFGANQRTTNSSGVIVGNRPGENGYGYLQLFGTSGIASSTNDALYFQDSWQPTQRLTLNLGVRAEKENVPSFAAGAPDIKFSFRDKIAPRLGFAYDVRGDGKLKIFASYGQFYDRFKYELPRGSFGGDKYTRTFFVIPAGITNPFFFTPAYAQANAVKLLDYRVPSNSPSDYRVDPNLMPVRQTEFTAGVQYDFLRNTILAARYTHKKLDHTIEDIGYHLPVSIPGTTITAGSEAYFIGNPGEGICQTGGCGREPVAPIPKAERKYDALEISVDHRFAQALALNASYTYSRLFGNYSGLASSDEFIINGTARSSPNVNRFFDQPFVGYNVGGQPDNGLLPTDRPHVFKFFGAYTYNWRNLFGHQFAEGGRNSTEFSTFFIAESGVPLTTRIFLVDVDYIPLYGRGDLGRTPVYTQTDFAISHKYRFGNDGRFAMAFDVNVLNLFNQNAVLARYEGIAQNELGPGDFGISGTPTDQSGRQQFDAAFFNGGITRDKILALINSGQNPRDVRYNQPILFQGGRQLRFGFRFIF